MGVYTSRNKEIKYRISQNIESQELTKYEQIGTCLNLQELMLYSVTSSYYWDIYCPANNLDYNTRLLFQWVVWKDSKYLSQDTHSKHRTPTHLDCALG